MKKTTGDLQTADRESVSARKRTEVEKFKGKLKEQELEQKSSTKISVGRLRDAVKLESEKLRMQGESAKRSQTQKNEKS